MRGETAAIVAMGSLFVFSNLMAMLLAIPFFAHEFRAFGDPNDVTNALLYFVLILGFTAIVLLIVKLKKENFVKYLILGFMAITMIFVFYLPLWYAFFFLPLDVRDGSASIMTLALSLGLIYALHRYPEWYVVDATAIAVAAGVTAIIGISFGILPALVLLVALAVYDAISVYETKHMVTLADAVAGLRLPILIVVPKRLPFSFLHQPRLKQQLASGEEREAMYMGLGDIIIPGILVVSAFINLVPEPTVSGVPANLLVALLTLAGTLVGFAALMKLVLSGRPQAGLPILNAGAILSYAISYYLLYRNLTFGIVF